MGHTQTYLQWHEGDQVRSRIVKDDELPTHKQLITKRKSLERRLQVIEDEHTLSTTFHLDVHVGDALDQLCQSVGTWRERQICKEVRNYLHSDEPEVCILYGLQRTGKYTTMLQVIAGMNDVDHSDAAFIEVKVNDTFGSLMKDLDTLHNLDYRFVFVGEVTLIEDFSERATPLADIYAKTGMRIVLSGTDSLSFWFAFSSSLYNRTVTIPTTRISYSEQNAVLGTTSIDDHLRYGGTMHKGGEHTRSAFNSTKKACAYVTTAIAHNIEQGLEHYRDGRNLRNLVGLWDADELKTAISHVLRREMYAFARTSIERVLASQNLNSTRQLPRDANDVSSADTTATLLSSIATYDHETDSTEINDAAYKEIRNWLRVIDAITSYEVRSLDQASSHRVETVTQPGLRYAQARELTKVLRSNECFHMLTPSDQALVVDAIETDLLYHMLKEVVFVETSAAQGNMEQTTSSREPDTQCEAFKLIGEELPSGKPCSFTFDMVTFAHTTQTLDLYEITHVDQIALEQVRHLTNDELVAAVATAYGATEPVGRHVLYRGPSFRNPLGTGVDYLNVEEYLLSL